MPENTNNSSRVMLTEGKVGWTLFRLTVPMIWGLFAIVAFHLVDTYFVGQLGTAQLAAMGFTFPVVMAIGGVALGLGIGASSAISRAVGHNDQLKLRRLTTDSLLLACLVVAVLAGLGLLTIDPLFRAMGAKPEVMPLIRQYMQIWYLGIVFLVVPMVGNSAIRALGDVKIPALIMTVAAVVNAVLDRFLIFDLAGNPWLGIRGAALATVIGRFTTMVAALGVLHYRERLLLFAVPKFRAVWESWKSILHVGLPAAGTNLALPFSRAVITWMMAYFGTEAVAAYGVASKIEAFALLVVGALASIMAPFVGQNFGARRLDRVARGLKRGFVFSLIYGALAAGVLAIFAQSLVSIFNKETPVMAVACTYLFIVPISYCGRGMIMISSAAFNGLGRPLPSTLMILANTVVLHLPLAWLGKWLVGYKGIFAATCVCNLAIGISGVYWSLRTCRRRGRGGEDFATLPAE